MVDRAGRRTVVRDGSLTANRPVRRVQRKRRLVFTAKRNVGTKMRDVRNDTGGGRQRNTETMSAVFPATSALRKTVSGLETQSE